MLIDVHGCSLGLCQQYVLYVGGVCRVGVGIGDVWPVGVVGLVRGGLGVLHRPAAGGPPFLQIANNVTLSHNTANSSGGVLYVKGELPELTLQVCGRGRT